MKKAIFLVYCLLVSVLSFAQLIQASLGPGSSPNNVKIYLKAAAMQTPAVISTLQFNIAIPASITPKPTLTIVSHAFGAAVWQTSTATEDGFYHFSIFTPTSPLTVNTLANTEIEAMEVQFCCGPNGTSTVSLVTLPDGGSGATDGKALFYVTGTLQSNGSNLYYGRAGVTVNNVMSYDVVNFLAGTGTSTAALGNVVLPVRWLGFNVVRQGNDAQISWNVDNDQDNEKYVVERSLDGVNFSSIGDVAKKPGNGLKQYNYKDANVVNLGSKIIYYRVRNVEVNNRISYTEIRNIRLDVKGEISLYPNPAKDGFTLSIPYLTPDQKMIQLHLVNSIGQILERKNISRAAATSYYYNVQAGNIVSGEYLLKIYEDGQLTETKRVLVKK